MATPAFEIVLACLGKVLLGLIRDESSASALIKPAVNPAKGTSQFRSSILTLKGLVQITFWSRPILRTNSTGLALAGCLSSPLWTFGFGVGAGAGELCPLSKAWPQDETGIESSRKAKTSLHCPIRSTHSLGLERSDNADCNSGAGKKGYRLAQVLQELAAAGGFVRYKDGISGLQHGGEDIA